MPVILFKQGLEKATKNCEILNPASNSTENGTLMPTKTKSVQSLHILAFLKYFYQGLTLKQNINLYFKYFYALLLSLECVSC